MLVEKISGERAKPNVPWFLGRILEFSIIAVMYWLIAKLSSSLGSLHPNASPIWPTAGFALACVVMRGYRVAPAIFLASFAVNAGTGISVLTALAIASGNT